MSAALPMEKIGFNFALEDLLGGSARVLQEKIFSTKHLGRIFDFYLFEANAFFEQSKNRNLNEYRCRQLLELLVFCGWTNYREGENLRCLELDCGWDGQRMILACSFLIDQELKDFDPTAKESQAVQTHPRAQMIVRMLEQMRSFSDGTLVRVQKEYSKLQIFCFVQADSELSQTAELHFLNLLKPIQKTEKAQQDNSENQKSTENSSEPVKVNNELLKPSTLAEGNVEAFLESEKQDQLLSKQKAITGAKKVHEFQDVKEELLNKVSVDKLEDTIDDKLRVNAEGDMQGSINLLLDALKSDIMPLCIGLSQEQFELAFKELADKIQENYSQTLQHLVKIKTIQMVSKVNHYKEQMKVMQGKIDSLKEEREELIEKVSELDANEAELLRVKAAMDADQEAKRKFDKTEVETIKQVKALEKKADEIEFTPPAKEWSREFIKAAEKERGLLNQKMREREADFKKKELDFSARENGLKEKLRVTEEKVKQQEFSVRKVKETLAQALTQLEKTRGGGKDGAGGSADELKAKLGATEKLLSGAKENIERMQKRVDDVQKKWQEEFNSRAALQKQLSESLKKIKDFEKQVVELSSPQAKNFEEEVKTVKLEKERLVKLVDEARLQNKELNRKVTTLTNQLNNATTAAAKGAQSEQKKSSASGSSSGSDAELKLKFERLQKIHVSTKEEHEKLKKKFDETRQEEMRLRSEVSKLQADLKNAAKGIAPKSNTPVKPPPASKSPLIQPKKPGTAGSGVKK